MTVEFGGEAGAAGVAGTAGTARANEADGGWRERVEDACYRIRLAELRAEAAFPVEALTLTLIVTRWLHGRAPGAPGRVFELDELTAADVVRGLGRATGVIVT